MKMDDRANTLAQKKDVLARLYRAWAKNPELRLGQMLFNVFGTTTFPKGFEEAPIDQMNIFYTEDFPFIKQIEVKMGAYETSKKKWGAN